MAMDSAAVLSGERMPVFSTANVREGELVQREQMEKNRRGWDGFIDRCLVEWGRDPSALADEGLIPPSLKAINLACDIAMVFKDQGLAPPTRVVPDGEGGVSFERVDGNLFVSLNVYADQTVELLAFDDCRLCTRHRLL